MAQMVKNPPAVWEIWFWSLGWEDPLEGGTPIFWPREFHGQRNLAGYSPWDCKGSDTSEEKAMAPHSSTRAWKIPWTEEPGRLQSRGSLRVKHDWETSLHFSLSCIGEGNGNPLQCSCLENPKDSGAWWAAVYGVAQSRTQLKWLSSGSSSNSRP